jgi:hypothetical protein
MLRAHCANDNHGRSVVTVRFCPTCGGLLNGKILARGCSEETHARMRRAQSAYCVHCGVHFAQGR